MYIKILKISLLQFFILLLISGPIGYFIYSKNFDKINYVAYISAGKLLTENYCLTYVDIPARGLIDRESLEKISKYFNKLYLDANPQYSGATSISYIKDKNQYQVIFGGKRADSIVIEGLIPSIISELKKSEGDAFKQKFENVKLHCDKVSYSVFRYVGSDDSLVSASVSQSYGSSHLGIGALGPFLFIYFLVVLFRYIRANYSTLVRIE